MTDNEIIEGLKRFAHQDSKTLKAVAISDGFAYATDGRIGLGAKLQEPHGDSVPEGYPLKSLRGIIDEAKTRTGWQDVNLAELKPLDEKFLKRVKSEFAEARASYNSRYKEFECPCCREKLYWDNDAEEVVREREEPPTFDARDVQQSLRIVFDQETSIVVNFCYLHMIHKVFGDGYIRFAIGKNKEGNDLLYMLSKDGLVHGVIMPMYMPHKESPADCTIGTVKGETGV